MKKGFQYISVLIITVVFLSTSVGFEMYHNFCECDGNTNVSVIKEVACCDSENDLCQPESNNEKPHDSENNSCKSNHKFVKFSYTYISSQKLEISGVFCILYQFYKTQTNLGSSHITPNPVCLNRPPIFFGKELVYFINSPKLPDNLL